MFTNPIVPEIQATLAADPATGSTYPPMRRALVVSYSGALWVTWHAQHARQLQEAQSALDATLNCTNTTTPAPNTSLSSQPAAGITALFLCVSVVGYW